MAKKGLSNRSKEGLSGGVNSRSTKKQIKHHIKSHKSTFAVYVILRILVVSAMLISFFQGNYENMFYCALSLVLFLIPTFVEKNLGIELPTALEITILLFIFCAVILGELENYYIKFPHWDTMLHTVNGFMCAAIGFALVDIFNRKRNFRYWNRNFKFELSPIFLTIFAFCFSMTIGVLWEFYEFGMDMIFLKDMQKDTVIHRISSVALDATNSNIPVIIDNIMEVYINGQELGLGGYLDIGLIDTMQDLFVNFIGAAAFSILGYFYFKTKGKRALAGKFIPTVKNIEGEFSTEKDFVSEVVTEDETIEGNKLPIEGDKSFIEKGKSSLVKGKSIEDID